MVHMHVLVLTKNQTCISESEAFSLVSFFMTFSSYNILEGTSTCSSWQYPFLLCYKIATTEWALQVVHLLTVTNTQKSHYATSFFHCWAFSRTFFLVCFHASVSPSNSDIVLYLQVPFIHRRICFLGVCFLV